MVMGKPAHVKVAAALGWVLAACCGAGTCRLGVRASDWASEGGGVCAGCCLAY